MISFEQLQEIDIKNNHGLFYTNQDDYFLSKIPSYH
jgi:hypothetical protein